MRRAVAPALRLAPTHPLPARPPVLLPLLSLRVIARLASARAILAVLLAGALAGCGLQPLYAGGGGGAVAQGLAAVDVAPIEGRAGWLMRSSLQDQLAQNGANLNSGGASNARYRLDVLLDDQLEGLGLLTDETIGRERRTLRARYQLVDLSSGEIMLDATAGSDAGIDVVSSEYATIAAEQTALENLSREVAGQIVTRLSLALRNQP